MVNTKKITLAEDFGNLTFEVKAKLSLETKHQWDELGPVEKDDDKVKQKKAYDQTKFLLTKQVVNPPITEETFKDDQFDSEALEALYVKLQDFYHLSPDISEEDWHKVATMDEKQRKDFWMQWMVTRQIDLKKKPLIS
jgi:hypothetical protein